jgi:hypothetical protein
VAGACEGGNEPSGSMKCGVAEDLLASQEGLCFMEFVCLF